jgi:glycosyltransferase involved in cell wall biosynthesis
MSKGRPLVSIAIPTYNRADCYLGQAIESALNQTYPHIEIIVSDNCSHDNTPVVVESFRDRRIRYVRHKENIGANNNFNYCLKEARGDYFLLLQDDDLIDRDFVEVCMKAAGYRTDIGLLRTGTRVIDDRGYVISECLNQVSGLNTAEFFRGWFANKTALYLCSTLFNTLRLREIGGFRSKHNLFQDVIAEVQLDARFGRIDINDIKASFRKHPNEMTFMVKVNQWCEDSLMLLDLMCELQPDSREVISEEGMRFFAMLNYNRARAVQTPLKKVIAYYNVFRMFNYRYLPSNDHLLSPIKKHLSGNAVYRGLRFVKRKISQAVSYRFQ